MGGRLGGRPAPRRYAEDRELGDDSLQGNADVVARTDAMCGLDPLAIEMHLAARNGRGRERARFVEACMPQPFVEAVDLPRVRATRTLIARVRIAHCRYNSGKPDRFETRRKGQPVIAEFRERLRRDTAALEQGGLLKRERIIGSAQGAVVRLADGREMINLCANNYLGLANHPAVLGAAHRALDEYGYGVASVRFICGTQSVHRELEQRLSAYLSMDDTILYSSCFDANGGLFETLLDEQDAVISDALNHASIIDGIRLCKARRLRYANNDLGELEACLKDAQGARVRMIGDRRRVLDGRFDREARGDLRPRRPIRSTRHGRRLACDRLHRRARPRHA